MTKINLKEFALKSITSGQTFQQFNQKVEILNRIYTLLPQRQPADKFTKQAKPNLKQLASKCLTFAEFQQKAEEA
jgi:5-bromo-4-chloroindolyl phosphate hydrolysis protein